MTQAQKLRQVEYIIRLSRRINIPLTFDEVWDLPYKARRAYLNKHDDGGYYKAKEVIGTGG